MWRDPRCCRFRYRRESNEALPSLSCLCIWALLAPSASAQLPTAEKPGGSFLWRSYKGATAGPISLHNSNRIDLLLRAGTLYLTVQDVIALAIENNLNLEVQRYSLPTAEWAVERAVMRAARFAVWSAGAPQIGNFGFRYWRAGRFVSRQLGIPGNGGGSGSVGGGGGAIIQQVGPVVVNLRPSLTGTDAAYHITTPFANQSGNVGVNPLVDSDTISTTSVQQGVATGGVFTFRNYYLRPEGECARRSSEPRPLGRT